MTHLTLTSIARPCCVAMLALALLWSPAEATPKTPAGAVVQPPPAWPADHPGRARAAEPLEDVLARLREQHETQEPGAFADPQALPLYVRGRSQLVAGNITEAIETLRDAAEADADSPAIQRALGRALRVIGRSQAGSEAYRRAAEFGSTEPLPLIIAGIDALERGEAEKAARWLAFALAPGSPSPDEAARSVAVAALGEALIRLGHLRAGADAIDRALRAPLRLTRPTALEQEVRAYSRLTGYRARLGMESMLRLGDPCGALELARAMLELEPFERADGAALVTAAAMRCGDPAAGATRLIEAAARRQEPVSAEAIASTAWLLSRRAEAAERAFPLLREAATRGARSSSATVRRSWTVLSALAGAQDTSSAALGLIAARPVAPDATAVAQIFRPAVLADPGAAPELAIRATRLRPEAARAIAAELIRLGGSGAPALLERGRGPAVLRIALLAEIGDAEGAAALARAGTQGEPRDDLLQEAARAFVNSGDWNAYANVLGALRAKAEADPRARLPLARALLDGQRYSEALEALAPMLQGPAPLEAVRLAAGAAVAFDPSTGEADRLSRRAVELDPFDAGALHARHDALRARAGDDPGAYRRFLARLRDRNPSRAIIAILAAEELVRIDRPGAAADRLLAVALRGEAFSDPSDLLASVWQSLHQDGGRESLDAHESALRSRLSLAPFDVRSVTLLADLLVARARPEAALATINEGIARRSATSLLRARETLLRDALGKDREADRARDERLAHKSLSIDETIELASVRASNGADPAVVLRRLPAETQLTPDQRAVVAQVAGRLAAATFADDALPGEIERFLGLSAWAVDHGVSLAPGIHERRLALLAGGEAAPAEVSRAARAAAAQHPDRRAAFLARAGQLLIGTGRGAAAFELLADATLTGDSFDPETFNAWLQAVGTLGGAADARRMIDRLRDADALVPAIERVRTLADPYEGEREPEASDITYVLALYASSNDRSAAAKDFYRLTLELDADHGWAANNLGYTLLDREGDLAAAEPLLEKAARLLPDSGSVIDSLGWLRYKQGVLEDPPEADSGRVWTLGAVSLLRRAVDLGPSGESDGVVLDHLGDALAAVGETGEAVDAWRKARRRAAAALQRGERRGMAPARSRELESLLERLRDKIRAAEADRPPPISRTPAAPWTRPAADDT